MLHTISDFINTHSRKSGNGRKPEKTDENAALVCE